MMTISRDVRVAVSPKRLEKLSRRVRQYTKSKKKFSDLSLVFVSDATIQALNKKFRHKNKPTDVLSFDYGEIFISVPTARRQARTHSVALTKEIDLLFVHGLLHISGYDHETAKQKAKMISLEKKILGHSGLIDCASSPQNKKTKKKTSKRI